jgi:hypothetical protein
LITVRLIKDAFHLSEKASFILLQERFIWTAIALKLFLGETVEFRKLPIRSLFAIRKMQQRRSRKRGREMKQKWDAAARSLLLKSITLRM